MLAFCWTLCCMCTVGCVLVVCCIIRCRSHRCRCCCYYSEHIQFFIWFFVRNCACRWSLCARIYLVTRTKQPLIPDNHAVRFWQVLLFVWKSYEMPWEKMWAQQNGNSPETNTRRTQPEIKTKPSALYQTIQNVRYYGQYGKKHVSRKIQHIRNMIFMCYNNIHFQCAFDVALVFFRFRRSSSVSLICRCVCLLSHHSVTLFHSIYSSLSIYSHSKTCIWVISLCILYGSIVLLLAKLTEKSCFIQPKKTQTFCFF